MSLLDLFKKKAPEPPQKAEKPDDGGEMEIYSGMRVEVTDTKDIFLFVAKLLGLRGDQAELHQYSEDEIPFPADQEPMPVKIRGYSDHERKAVYMEGRISPLPHRVWAVTELRVSRVANDRAFFRLETNRDATVTMFSGLEMGEKPCKLVNISIGGACISSERRYHEGDKFMLRVKLVEDRPESAMFSQVMRVIEKDGENFEYGCRFLEMTDDDQEKISQNIFAAQRLKRGRT